jgi:hypothetical protein
MTTETGWPVALLCWLLAPAWALARTKTELPPIRRLKQQLL